MLDSKQHNSKKAAAGDRKFPTETVVVYLRVPKPLYRRTYDLARERNISHTRLWIESMYSQLEKGAR